MRTTHHLFSCVTLTLTMALPITLHAEEKVELNPRVQPETIRDLMWVWATPNMDSEGEHTLATWAGANTTEKMQLLGL